MLKQVESLFENIRKLRNRMAPINRIPPELLCTIFEHTTMDELHRPFAGWPQTRPRPYSWQIIQSVCHHWRQMALRTPVLWSYISICDRVPPSPRPVFDEAGVRVRNSHLVDLSLRKSGVVPLVVQLDGQGKHSKSALRTLTEKLAAESWRIRKFAMHHVDPSILKAFIVDFSSLEVLVLGDRARRETFRAPYNAPVKKWCLPRLRTLAIFHFTGWYTGTFHTLRHLILTHQRFDIHLLRGLHDLLRSNSGLEDLVLSEIQEQPDLSVEVDSLLPVQMQALKRISLSDSRWSRDRPVHSLIDFLERKVVHGRGYAKNYHLENSADAFVLLGTLWTDGHFLPTHSLFISQYHFVGTDGHASHRVSAAHTLQLVYCLCCSLVYRSPPTEEFWLWLPHKALGDTQLFLLTAAMRVMKYLRKLVLRHSFVFWLDRILERGLFPALTELQLHLPQKADLPSIKNFLLQRATSGLPITILRVVVHPPYSHDIDEMMACFTWTIQYACREDMSDLEQLVPRFSFEDTDNPPDGGPSSMGPRMKLPAMCTTPPEVHSFWNTQDWEMKC